MRPARGRRIILTALRAVALGAMLAACGPNEGSQPTWSASHPGTAAVTFQATAPGVCAITVRYPDAAPAALGYLGATYVQVSRQPHPAAPAGRDLGPSGDWRVLLQPAGDILIVTPGDAFDYRPEVSC